MYYTKKGRETAILSQGDIFLRFENKAIPKSEVKELGFMILTYTCDLEHPNDLNYILFCPIFDFDILIEKYIKINQNKSIANINEALGDIVSKLFSNDIRHYFFLSPIPEIKENPAYAHLEQITKIPKQFMRDLINNRIISLKRPWKEKLGWMTGNLFNRIALEDMDKTIPKQYIQTSESIKDFIEIRCNQIKSSLIKFFERNDEITQLFKEKIFPIFLENDKTTRDMLKTKLNNTLDMAEIKSIFEKITSELKRRDNDFLRDLITFEKKHHKLENFRINDLFKSIINEVINLNN